MPTANKQPHNRHHLVRLLLIGAGLILLLTWWVYSRVLTAGFINLDDYHYITHVRPFTWDRITTTFTSFFEGYHPLTLVSLGFDFHVAAFDPALFHLNNLLLHLLNVALVACLAQRLLRKPVVTLVTAAVFALHPVHVEAVAWITSRKDLLHAVFYLGALLVYASARVPAGRTVSLFRLAATMLLFILAALAKGMAVSLPLALLCIDYLWGRRLFSRAVLLEKAPFFAVSAAFGILAILSQNASGYVTADELQRHLLERLALSAWALVLYIRQLLVPLNLAPYYPYPDDYAGGSLPMGAYLALAMIPAGLALLWGQRKRLRPWVFCTIFFLATLVLVLQIVPVAGFIAADRYNYISSVGFAMLLGLLLHRVVLTARVGAALRMTAIAAMVLYVLALATLTHRLTAVWTDSLSLWRHAVREIPQAAFSWNMLGTTHAEAGDYDAALRAFERAERLQPQNPRTYVNRGYVHDTLGSPEAAIADYTAAIDRAPGAPLALNNRGLVYMKTGRYKQALDDFDNAVRNGSRHVMRHLFLDNRAQAHLALGNGQASYDDASRAITVKPNFGRAYRNRALAAAQLSTDPEQRFNDLIAATHYDPADESAWLLAIQLCVDSDLNMLAKQVADGAVRALGTNISEKIHNVLQDVESPGASPSASKKKRSADQP